MSKKPQINTFLYAHFVETAVMSYPFLLDGEEHACIRVRACDGDGNNHGTKDHIRFSCEFWKMQRSSVIQYIRENVWSVRGHFQYIDNANEYGMPLDGFTAWDCWRLRYFLDDEEKKLFPKYRDYEYILQCLGECTTNIKGVDSVRVRHRKSWRDGFDVWLERDPTDAKARIIFGA